jgi:UDP-glucose 4-epimerase
MKIVITGANSYIGNCLQNYIQNIDREAEIFQLDVEGEQWRGFDFYGYDTVVHVAAIVHRKDHVSEAEYNRVNAELTAEIAQKAKTHGVGQFVFLSTMAVYGVEKSLQKKKAWSPKIQNCVLAHFTEKANIWLSKSLRRLQMKPSALQPSDHPMFTAPDVRGAISQRIWQLCASFR